MCTLLQYYWGDKVNEQKVLEQLDAMLKPAERRERIKEGLSLTDLRRVSVKLGYVASIGTLTFEQLSQSKIPVLVPLTIGKFNHFAIYRGTDGFYVYLADPARGNVRTRIDEFQKQWQKNAILVVAKKDQDLRENCATDPHGRRGLPGDTQPGLHRKAARQSDYCGPLRASVRRGPPLFLRQSSLHRDVPATPVHRHISFILNILRRFRQNLSLMHPLRITSEESRAHSSTITRCQFQNR